MIVRIMGEGQFEVSEERVEELNRLDQELQKAVDDGDEDAFGTALQGLLASVRTAGSALPEDYLGPSELVLPSPDSTIEEVRAVLGEEGLIPG
jgi:PspA-Associated protein